MTKDGANIMDFIVDEIIKSEDGYIYCGNFSNTKWVKGEVTKENCERVYGQLMEPYESILLDRGFIKEITEYDQFIGNKNACEVFKRENSFMKEFLEREAVARKKERMDKLELINKKWSIPLSLIAIVISIAAVVVAYFKG